MERKLTFKEKLLAITKRQKKKANKHSIIFLLVSVVLLGLLMMLPTPQATQATKDSDTRFTASFVGDMLFGRYVEEVTKHNGYDFLFENVKPYLLASDYVTGNFEQAVTKKETYKPKDKPIVFQASSDSVKALKKANFTVINVANNHFMDYNLNGLRDSFSAFNKYNLPLVGAVKEPLVGEDSKQPGDVYISYYGQQINLSKLVSTISYVNKNGLKVATLGFTDDFRSGFRATTERPGVLPANVEIMLPLIKEAKSKADLVFVHMHWGVEYDMEPSKRMKDLAKVISDAGADVIIGHHTHVLSSVDVYNNTIIFYGLGNFIFDQGWSRTKDSVIAQYHVSNNGQVKVELVPLRIREARPQQIGTLGQFYRLKVFRELTKYTSNKQDWVVENGKLVYSFTNPSLSKLGNVDDNGK